MKKVFRYFFSFLSVIGLILSTAQLNVYAEEIVVTEENAKIDAAIEEYDHKVASNLDELTKRCLNGEIGQIKEKSNEEIESLSNQESPYEVLEYEISEEVFSNNNITTMADTTLYVFTDPSASTGNNGEKRENGSDSTYSVSIYSIIYYNKMVGYDGLTYYNFYRAAGGRNSIDSGVQIIDRYVGMLAAGGGFVGSIQENNSAYPTSDPWSYATGFTEWYLGSNYFEMGINYQVTLSRGGSPWVYTLMNRL